jgi:diaminopropionate ammonia-lyase
MTFMHRISYNPHRPTGLHVDAETTAAFTSPDIQAVHLSLEEYCPTPLIELPGLAARLGLGRVLVKDEAHRFGLKAFKALGASYAVSRLIKEQFAAEGRFVALAKDFYRQTDLIRPGQFTFCTATDGNHGRGVAWVARKLRQHAVIYMPKNSAVARINNILGEGAKVTVIDGPYDDAVRQAAHDAETNGWTIISDTSWPGYECIPRWIMAGYLTMFREIHDVLTKADRIDAVLVQGGVGTLAAAASWYYNIENPTHSIRLIAVEPVTAACLKASIDSPGGEPRSIHGESNTIMAGLNCGTPSPTAWPLIKQGFAAFMTVSDDICIRAMRTFHYPYAADPRIISGESGAAGLAGLLSLCEDTTMSAVRDKLGLGRTATILLLNTEGDTDPESFGRLVRST